MTMSDRTVEWAGVVAATTGVGLLAGSLLGVAAGVGVGLIAVGVWLVLAASVSSPVADVDTQDDRDVAVDYDGTRYSNTWIEGDI